VTPRGLVVVVTGGAGGIGRATAHRFVREGASVFIADVDENAADEAVSTAPADLGSIEFVRCDVTDPSDVEALMRTAAAGAGGIDVVVANAGILRAVDVVDMEPESWDQVMAVNARSCFLTAKFAIPHLRARRGGAIVNMSSLGGIKGAAGLAAYAASKGAIIALTKSLAAELAPDSIRVNCVCPGWVATSFNAPVVARLGGAESQERLVREVVPLARQGTPDEVAECVYFLATAATYVTGQALVVDGGRY
jgi:dihydroanticapsin dehydrogenase